MLLQDNSRDKQHRYDAYATVFALAGMASLPMIAMLAISALVMFIGRNVLRFFG